MNEKTELIVMQHLPKIRVDMNRSKINVRDVGVANEVSSKPGSPLSWVYGQAFGVTGTIKSFQANSQ
jgi:hypothetical protein